MKITFKSFLMMGLVFGGSFYGSAQTEEQRAKIIKNYDQKKLSELKETFDSEYLSAKSEAVNLAKINGWPVIKKNLDGTISELQKISPEGKPLYFTNYNAGSAITSRVDRLNSGGSLGLNLNGQGMIAGVWDGGAVKTTHQDLTGRVIIKDGVPFNQASSTDHPTHVTGTVIGSGAGNANARGMAYQATAWTNDWNNDESEAINQASQGLLISNHSYGLVATSVPLYYFGAYIQDSKNWDNIMYNAPYYLMVAAAGNDRSTYTQYNPTKVGYDLLTSHATSKNGIIVGAVNQVSNYTGPNSVVMSSFSNYGPTDDGRIKPDLVTKGVGVFSTIAAASTPYGQMNGTSMSSPGMTGTLLLLQQHYNNLNSNFMKAATLKALAIHTADEAGNADGPDYTFGWGLVNAERAANLITGNGVNSVISEHTLDNGKTFTTTVTSTGTEPLLATICWTDPSGTINTGTVDLSTPALVNDLDIRVVQNGTTIMPYKLNPATPQAAATKGDNLVDPIEKVKVPSASGSYTITVSHKGALVTGKQDFSLVVSGIGSSFNISSTEPAKTMCATEDAVYAFNYVTLTANPTVITSSNLPENATITFSQNNPSANGTFTATIGNLANVLPGKYSINIIGTNGTESKTYSIELNLFKQAFSPIVQVSPIADNQNTDIYTPLQWERDANAQSYFVQIATDAAFTNIVEGGTVVDPIFYPTIANNNQQYYWRVKAVNLCGESAFSTSSYKTKNLTCVSGTNTTPLVIPVDPENNLTSTITVTENIAIEDLNVLVNLTHSELSEVTLNLIGPNGIVIKLQAPSCFGAANIDAMYDDSALTIVCGTNPAVSGRVKPVEPLSVFNGLSSAGVWKLQILDPQFLNGGTLNSWEIQMCKQAPLGTDSYNLDSFALWPNPAGSFANIKFNSQSNDIVNATLFDLNGRIVQNQEFESTGGLVTKTLDIQSLASGVYIVKVSQGDKQSVGRLIKK